MVSLRSALGGVEGDGAESPGAERGAFVTDGSEESGKFPGPEEAGDGVGQIGVRGAVSGEPAADPRKDAAEIPAIQIAEQVVGWFGEVEDGQRAAGFEDAMDFAQAGVVVGEIAEAESGGDEVEGFIGEGEAQGVGFDEWESRRRGQAGMAAADDALGAGAGEHGVGEIGANDPRGAGFAEGESEIAGAAAEIEDERVGALQDETEESCGAGAPEAVEIDRKDVVERVVGGRDAGKHFADFLGGVGFRSGAGGTRAGGGVSGHV